MFSILHKTNFKFSVMFILLSAYAFNLDQSKILSFGKELMGIYIVANFGTDWSIFADARV